MPKTNVRIEDLNPSDPATLRGVDDTDLRRLRQAMSQKHIPDFTKRYQAVVAEMERRGLKRLNLEGDSVLSDAYENAGEELFSKHVDPDGAVSFRPFVKAPPGDSPPASAGEPDSPDPEDPPCQNFEKRIEFSKKDAAMQIATGIVYEPNVIDAHGDWMDEAEIKSAMIDFMKNSRRLDVMHAEPAEMIIVENFIAPADILDLETDVMIRKGTWVMSVFIPSRQLWKRVESGELGGFSIAGTAVGESGAPPAKN